MERIVKLLQKETYINIEETAQNVHERLNPNQKMEFTKNLDTLISVDEIWNLLTYKWHHNHFSGVVLRTEDWLWDLAKNATQIFHTNKI